jgi:hypothetical protein
MYGAQDLCTPQSLYEGQLIAMRLPFGLPPKTKISKVSDLLCSP